MSAFPLHTLCECGCRFGQHKAVQKGQPMPCKGKGDTCSCRNFKPSGDFDPVEQAAYVFEQAIVRDLREQTPDSFADRQDARLAYLEALGASVVRTSKPATLPPYPLGGEPQSLAKGTMHILLVIALLTALVALGCWLTHGH